MNEKRKVELVKILFGGKDKDKPDVVRQAQKDWFIYMRPLREVGLNEEEKKRLDEYDAKTLAEFDSDCRGSTIGGAASL